MIDWFLETGIYLLGVTLIPAVGLLLICWGLWGNRSEGRFRWWRMVVGGVLVLLSAYQPMPDLVFATGNYLIGFLVVLLIGLLFVCWGLWGDRSKGRARCPQCWNDMRSTIPRLKCPECGHDASQARRLYNNRYRWWRFVLGGVLVYVSAFHETSHWFHTTGVYMLGIVLIPAAGMLLVCWGIWGDRSKGRVRCPKCWYDMRGTVPRLECPECGHDAQQERQLHRTRRGRRRIILGVGLLLLSTYPLTIIGGWWREQAAMRTYEIHMSDQKSIGPAWLVERLPDQLARFFDRGDGLNVDDSAQLPALQRLRHLRWLVVRAEDATDADLVYLKHLSKLETLVLAGTQVTDAVLVYLKSLPKLKHLLLANTQLTGTGLVHLKGLSDLQTLELSDTQLTDAGLVHLAGLSKLEHLYLSGTQLTDTGLVHLKGLSDLQTLGLSDTQLTDAGLVHLAGLSKLGHLYLSGTQVTDAGLVHLIGLSKLVYLKLSGTQVTGVGVAKLKQALPNVSVVFQ